MKIKGKDPARLWERYIRRECEMLAEQGRSDVRKNWEAPRLKGSHEKWEASAPDFGGCAIINGEAVPVLFEAKRVGNDTRLPLDNVSDDQMEDLKRRTRLGGIAFIYVLTKSGQKHIIRVGAFGIIDPLTPRGGSAMLTGETLKSDGETWLDWLEGRVSLWTP